jgi:hypothetical protein
MAAIIYTRVAVGPVGVEAGGPRSQSYSNLGFTTGRYSQLFLERNSAHPNYLFRFITFHTKQETAAIQYQGDFKPLAEIRDLDLDPG